MRRLIYFLSLVLFLISVVLTLTSLALPNWLAYTSPDPSSSPSPVRITYGLHSRCSSITGTCEPFPRAADCRSNEGRAFCSLWRTTGFLMNFVVVLELACAVAYIITLTGGRGKREGGWKMISGFGATVVLGQVAAMAIVAYLNNNDERFQIGWALDTSTMLCIVSWIILGANVAGLVTAAHVLPPEDDYEQIE